MYALFATLKIGNIQLGGNSVGANTRQYWLLEVIENDWIVTQVTIQLQYIWNILQSFLPCSDEQNAIDNGVIWAHPMKQADG